MRPKERRESGQTDLLRSRLDQILNMDHALVKLAKAIDWRFLEERLGEVYDDDPGRPPLPTRLMAGLAILKSMHNLSDEALCERWLENPYYRVPRSWCVFASATVSKMGDKASRSRPAGAGSKPPHAAAHKRRGRERWGKGGARRRQVSVEKMSASEPLMTHRNGFRRCRNGRRVITPGGVWTTPAYGPRGSRCIGGMSSFTGFGTERGNLAWGAKGNPQAAHTAREKYRYP
jgi:hypothetical protein